MSEELKEYIKARPGRHNIKKFKIELMAYEFGREFIQLCAEKSLSVNKCENQIIGEELATMPQVSYRHKPNCSCKTLVIRKGV